MNKFVWFEYFSTDAAKAQGFFGELFGWTTKKVPMGPDANYTMIVADGVTIGGYDAPPPHAPQHARWLSHLAVANAKESATKAASLGGRVLLDATKIGDMGTVAIILDVGGTQLALWQPAQQGETPAPANGRFCWSELYAADPMKSVAFYTQLTGLSTSAMEMPGMGTYHLLSAGEEHVAGVLAPPMPGAPTQWLPYVQVASADATTEKAKRLGATLQVPPTDIPNIGRFAIFGDPQGASLGILQSA